MTFGIKVPAGIFIPTLGIGALFGRIVGEGVAWLYLMRPEWGMFRSCGGDGECIIPGMYAMVRFHACF